MKIFVTFIARINLVKMLNQCFPPFGFYKFKTQKLESMRP